MTTRTVRAFEAAGAAVTEGYLPRTLRVTTTPRGPALRVFVTETGAFIGAHRTDVAPSLTTTLRTLQAAVAAVQT